MATIIPKDSKSERGPLEIIEGKGIKVPIYLALRRGEESFLLAYYKEGKRKMERVSSIEDARRRAKALIDELSAGKLHVTTFTLKQTAVITDALEIIEPFKVGLTDVARQYAEARRILGDTSLLQAAEFFAKHREREQRRGALQPGWAP